MAAAGDGRTANPSPYETGGAGGKFRKRPLRRSQTGTTPYDRPITAVRNPSWLTKLVVDPATKLISSGAQRLLSSLFSKRPLPPPSEGSQESKDLLQESYPNDHAGAVVAVGHKDCNAVCSSGGSAFSDLEQLLNQKTFSRAEIDRLTELLHSKTVDTPVGNDRRAEAIQYSPLPDISSCLPERNRSDKVTSDAAAATPGTSSRVPKNEIASPAELAKAYMGSRASNVSPSILGSKNQVVRVDTPLLKDVAYSQNLPITSVTTKTAGLTGVRANGFTTPRSRGRSAIYNMACSPYSIIRQTDAHLASSSTYNAYGGLSSNSVSERDGYFGSKQPLKRRSSVIDDDLGSVGTMRRTRQKPNLLSHGDNDVNTTTHTGYVHVSSRSSETAAKILEHLENMTPKEKRSESKFAAGKDKAPNKMIASKLRGQALKSLESLDSSKLLLQSAQDNDKLENWSKVVPTDAHVSSLKKQGEIVQHRQNKFINEVAAAAKNDAKSSFEDAQLGAEIAGSPDKNPGAQSLKKHAFRMSALEDSFELDEDIDCDGSASQLAEGRDKMGIFGAEKSLSTDETFNKPAAILETKVALGILNKRDDIEAAPDAAVTSVNSPSILASAGPPSPEVFLPSLGSNKPMESSVGKRSRSLSNLASGPAGSPSQLLELDNSQKNGKSNGKLEALSSGLSPSASFADPSSSSSLSNGQFAPSTSVSAAIGSTAGNSITLFSSQFGSTAASSVSTEPPLKLESSEVPPTVSVLSTTSSVDNADLKTKATNFGSSPFAGSYVASTSSGNGIFGFGSSGMSAITTASIQSQSSISSAQNSLAGSDSATVSQSAPAHFGPSSSSPEVVNSGMVFSSSDGCAVSSGSNLVGSSTAASGKFSFGASPAVSTALTTTLAASSNTTPGIFGFGVNTSSSSTNAVGTSTPPSPSVFGFGGSSAASSLNNVSNSTTTAPAIFSFGGTSSASSTNIVTNASTNATPATFSFGGTSSTNIVTNASTNATPGMFSFGGSSPGSSTNAVNASTTVTPGVFNFGGTSSALSTNAVNASTTATPGIFNFGATSSALSTNAVNASTTATPGVFSFGATSSASSTNAVNASTATTPSLFSFSGSSSALSTNAVNANTAASPSPFAFGATSASSQTSNTAGIFGFSSPFSSTTPSGFTFGASTTSFTSPTVVFGSASGNSGPAFPFGATTSTNSSPQPIFGNSTTLFTASPGNNDQMSMEDSMAEDSAQASFPAVPFGQPSVSPSPGGFMFGQPTVSPSPGGSMFGATTNPFQFNGQQSQTAVQNPSPFAASGSSEFSGGLGGSFSLGSNGPDKSGRKFVKVNRNKNRKK